MSIEFKPHHFLCTVGFEGKGYSQLFVKNFQALADQLRRDPGGDSVQITVVRDADSICAPCPNLRGTLCATQEKISTLDSNHARVLGIQPGDQLTWKQAKALILEKMTPEAFDQACAPCGWKPLGICRSALDELRRTASGALAIAISVGLMLATVQPHEASAGNRKRTRLRLPAAQTAKAKKPKPKPSPSPSPSPRSTPEPVDAVREKVYKDFMSKSARAIKEAHQALKDGKFERARKIAGSQENDDLFGDHAHAVIALAYRHEAAKSLEKKKPIEVQALGVKSLTHWMDISLRHPNSSWMRDLSEEMAKTEIVMADAHHARKKWKLAQALYERAFQRLSVTNGLLGTVDVDRLGRYAESCSQEKGSLCDSWLNRFAGISTRGSEELKAIAKYWEEANDRASPPRYGNRRTQAYKSPDSDQIALEGAMDYYSHQKYGQAVNAFQKFLDEFPKSTHRFRVRYWLAQALTQQQEHEKSRRVLEDLVKESPLTYYGMLASISAGIPIEPFIDGTLPQAFRDDTYLFPAESLRLRRAERFVAEKARDLASLELKELKPRDGYSNPLMMYLATLNAEIGNHSTTFQLLQEMVLRGYDGVLTSYGLRLIFPAEYMDIVQKEADANQIDPILILGLIKQESAFDPSAVSSSGASGLMQLMPATAVDTEAGVKRADLVFPEVNVRIGTKYLRQMLTRFNGNIAMALAGYNAGPNAVARWIKEGKAERGMLEFIEAIPYKETREYVAAIIRNHYWYSKRLHEGGSPKGLSYFWNMSGPPEPPAKFVEPVEESARFRKSNRPNT